jgi:hypothetical protein
MLERVTGFDWDEGNRATCQKHGLSAADIEGLFERAVMVLADAARSHAEECFRAIGTTATGRYVFLMFTIRERAGERLIRPIIKEVSKNDSSSCPCLTHCCPVYFCGRSAWH